MFRYIAIFLSLDNILEDCPVSGGQSEVMPLKKKKNHPQTCIQMLQETAKIHI